MTASKHVPEDSDLLLDIKNGKSTSFDLLYNKYYKDLYRYGLKISKNEELTKDAIQEIFLNLWQLKNTVDSIRFINFYLLKSLRRLLIRQLVKEQKTKNVSISELSDQYSPHLEHGIVNEEWSGHVVKLLSKKIEELPQRQQQALRLRFYQGMEYDQIACTMNVNYQSVLNHVHKSMKSLRTSEQVQQVAHYRVA